MTTDSHGFPMRHRPDGTRVCARAGCDHTRSYFQPGFHGCCSKECWKYVETRVAAIREDEKIIFDMAMERARFTVAREDLIEASKVLARRAAKIERGEIE